MADLIQPEIDEAALPALSAELALLADVADQLQVHAVEPSTQRAYASLQRTYVAFCRHHRLDPFAPATVALYVADCYTAQEPPSTLRSRLAAIARLALDSGKPNPVKSDFVRTRATNAARKLTKTHGEPRRVAPALYEDLEQLLTGIDGTDLVRLRDRALILFGHAIGRRGSEIVNIDVGHIQRFADGWLIAIPYSKTNHSGEPEYVGVPRFVGDPLCPIASIEEYMDRAHIMAGPVFRTFSVVKGRGGNRMRREDIARRIDRIAQRAGFQGRWRSHSLRRGFVTDAEQRNVARSRTRAMTGWKSEAMFAVYADHRNKIRESPLHEIYGRRLPEPRLL